MIGIYLLKQVESSKSYKILYDLEDEEISPFEFKGNFFYDDEKNVWEIIHYFEGQTEVNYKIKNPFEEKIVSKDLWKDKFIMPHLSIKKFQKLFTHFLIS
jgi:hypothetical protein